MAKNHEYFGTYGDIHAWMQKARNFHKGRPFRSWGRLRPDPTYADSPHPAFLLYMQASWLPDPVFRVHPDNTVEFLVGGGVFRSVAHSLTAYLDMAFPFRVLRIGKNRYHVFPLRGDCPEAQAGYEIFSGLRFNMVTGVAENALVTPQTADVSPEARRKWLRALRRFKRLMKIRIKLVGDTGQTRQKLMLAHPEWATADWAGKDADLLYNALVNDEYSEEFIGKFMLYASRQTWFNTLVKEEHYLKALDSMCDTASVEMRRRFGVFV